jgi:hypothetical protein
VRTYTSFLPYACGALLGPERVASRSCTDDEDHGEYATLIEELKERFADAAETKAEEAEKKVNIAQTEFVSFQIQIQLFSCISLTFKGYKNG